MFQRRKLGPLVGTRTWGGLVGISGYPPLMDGGGVTAASFGVMDETGHWAVENVGVTPDVEVAPMPTDVVAGWAAGAVWASACWLGARWLQRRGQVETPESSPASATTQQHESLTRSQ